MESEEKKNIGFFLYCARYGHLEGVKFDIEKKNVHVNSTDSIGRTLHYMKPLTVKPEMVIVDIMKW